MYSKLFKLATYFERKAQVELKKYREDTDSDSTESKVEKALKKHQGDDVDLSLNGQHYGWFIWDPQQDRHEQRDMNDFKADDKIKDVREFVHALKKINL